MIPVQGGLANLDAQVPQLQRRWSMNVLTALGLSSNASRDRVAASTIATAARVDEASFKPAQGPHSAASLQGGVQANDDKAYVDLVAALDTFEKAPLPRGQAVSDALRKAARDAAAAPAVQADPRCLAAVNAIVKQLRPYDLRDQVVAMGQPANWTSAQATQASAAKVELDLLSLVNPQADPLPNGSGVNSSYWIDRQGGSGAEKHSYICKPMSQASQIDGIVAGGEVAREAMSARTAEALTRMTGIAIPIPETHVIELDPGIFPGAVTAGPTGRITASVQEARPCQGSAKDASQADMAQFPAAQCQAVAIADMIMLNVDRHGDNILIDGTDLVPIDHGGTFLDPTMDGALRRITKTMGSSHNCLMQMPGSHEAIPQNTLNSLKQIDPDALTIELRQKRDELAQTTPDAMVIPPQQGPGRAAPRGPPPEVMSNNAIAAAGRSARFVKIAAEFAGLSAASMQIAMAGAATILFDPATSLRDFERFARKALQKALDEQDVTREACLLNGMEFVTVNAELDKRGWLTSERGRPPSNGVNGDPAFAMKLAVHGIARDTTIQHGLTPSNKTNENDLQLLLEKFPRYKKQVESKTIDKKDLALEIACCKELQKCDPVELADIERFGMVGNAAGVPSRTLAVVKQLRHARDSVEVAEQTSGRGVAGIKDKVIALKLRSGQRMLTMVRGPLNAVHSQALVAAFRTHDLDTVSQATNDLMDLIRTNMAREIVSLLQANAIDQGTADHLKQELARSKIEEVEPVLASASANPRPDAV